MSLIPLRVLNYFVIQHFEYEFNLSQDYSQVREQCLLVALFQERISTAALKRALLDSKMSWMQLRREMFEFEGNSFATLITHFRNALIKFTPAHILFWTCYRLESEA